MIFSKSICGSFRDFIGVTALVTVEVELLHVVVLRFFMEGFPRVVGTIDDHPTTVRLALQDTVDTEAFRATIADAFAQGRRLDVASIRTRRASNEESN